MRLLSSFPFTEARHKLKVVPLEQSREVLLRRGVDPGQPLSVLPLPVQDLLRAGGYVASDPAGVANSGVGAVEFQPAR